LALRHEYIGIILLVISVTLFSTIPSSFAASSASVSVPSGSSVPGCEETNACWIPAQVTVDVGGTVTWSNDDTAAHTVTSGVTSDGNSIGLEFDSGLFLAGSTFSHKFQSSGTFDYFCIVHPWMQGSVIVQGSSTSSTPAPAPYGTDVTIPSGTSVPGCENSNSCFVPSTVSVSAGKSLTWYNADSAAHTVTSGTPSEGPDGMFDSSLFLAGSSFSHTFTQSDTIDYYCMVHPWMQGTVIVGSGSSPIPTGPAITVTTDKSSYKSGDFIRISGEVRDLLSGFPVTMQVISANGNIVTIVQVEVNSFKKFSKTLVDTDGPLWGSTGTYTVKVIYGTESRTAETTFYFSSSGSSAPPKPIPTPETDITVTRGSSVPGCENSKSCYLPYSYRTSSGQKVTWYNADSAAHTVTSGNPSDGNSVGVPFDSSLFMAGSTFSYIYRSAGTYEYFCLVHPWMSGQVIVDGGGTSDSLFISTDKSSYNPGDLVNIQAKVTGSSSANVAVSVTDSSGDNILSRTISTGSSGFGDLDFRLDDNSDTGTYIVVGTASIGGSTQKDSAAHTVTSGHPSSAGSVGAQFDSSLFMSGTTFSHKFQSSGTYDYFCIVHPWMSGQVIVGSGGISGSLLISTDKSSYNPGDLVNIQAKVTGSSSANVAVSVTDSSVDNILSRTISTGSSGFGDLDFRLDDNSNTGTYNVVGTVSISGSTQKDSASFLVKSQAGRVSIVSLQATDQQGNTVSSFSKGKLSFAKVILSSDSSVSSLVTVNLFDSDLTSLGIGSFKTTLY